MIYERLKKGYVPKWQGGQSLASTKERVRLTETLRGQAQEASCTVVATKVSLPNSGMAAFANYSVESVSKPLPEGTYELFVNGSLILLRHQNGHGVTAF